MRRGSSNKVVERQSLSSNTTAPTDTPSGAELNKQHVTLQAYFLPLPARLQQPLNEKTEPGCSQNPEFPASMPPQVRCQNLHYDPAAMFKDTEAYTLPKHALAALCHLPSQHWC